jgi:hypothetical protein
VIGRTAVYIDANLFYSTGALHENLSEDGIKKAITNWQTTCGYSEVVIPQKKNKFHHTVLFYRWYS